MRGLLFLLGMLGLLPMAVAAPMVGVLAYYWISFMSPQTDVWGIAAAPPWALLSVLVTLIGCVVAREPKRWPRNGMIPLVIAFMILTSVASYFALGPRALVMYNWTQVLKTLFFLLVLAVLLSTRKRVQALVWVMALSLGFYGVAGGLFAIATGGTNRIFGPPSSIIGDNNQLALALLMTIPLMNFLRLQSKQKMTRVTLVVVMALTLVSVLASYSRGAFVGLAAVAVFFWWNSRHKLVIGLAMVLVIGAGIRFMPKTWTERMDTLNHYKKDASAEARLTAWREAFGIALARPLVGGGYKSTASATVLHRFYPDAHPIAVHSIWFEVMSENGFPAFGVWAAMMVLGFVNIRRIRRLARGDPELRWAEDLARMAEVSLIAFATAGTFLSMGYYDLYFALLVALGATRDILLRSRQVATVAAAPVGVGRSRVGRTTRPPHDVSPAPARGVGGRAVGSAARPIAGPAWRLRRLER